MRLTILSFTGRVIGGSHHHYSSHGGRGASRVEGLAGILAALRGLAGWGPLLVLSIGIALFSGCAGTWFAPGRDGWPLRIVQMALGSVAMGALVSFLGNVLVSRHAWRWGALAPLIVLGGGAVLALLLGKEGALALAAAAPLLSGMAVAAGLAMAFAVDGIAVQGGEEG